MKRALGVKMVLQGIAPAQVCQILNVSPQYVSKWKGRYEAEGAGALGLGYRGSESHTVATLLEVVQGGPGIRDPP